MKSETKSEKIKLLLPSAEMKRRVMDYRDAFLQIGEARIHGSAGLHKYESFDEWLAYVRPKPQQDNAPVPVETIADGLAADDWPPTSTFIAVRLSDNTIVGMANIRHYLTEAHYHDGHIGYSVHPNERGKGCGTEILRLALLKADQLGIIETVVSCDANNRASKRVMEKNKLKFQNKFRKENGETLLIYTTA